MRKMASPKNRELDHFFGAKQKMILDTIFDYGSFLGPSDPLYPLLGQSRVEDDTQQIEAVDVRALRMIQATIVFQITLTTKQCPPRHCLSSSIKTESLLNLLPPYFVFFSKSRTETKWSQQKVLKTAFTPENMHDKTWCPRHHWRQVLAPKSVLLWILQRDVADLWRFWAFESSLEVVMR